MLTQGVTAASVRGPQEGPTRYCGRRAAMWTQGFHMPCGHRVSRLKRERKAAGGSHTLLPQKAGQVHTGRQRGCQCKRCCKCRDK